MTEIVERLRKLAESKVMRDAADEIERLRTALEWITEHHDVQAMLTKAREALRANEQSTTERRGAIKDMVVEAQKLKLP